MTRGRFVRVLAQPPRVVVGLRVLGVVAIAALGGGVVRLGVVGVVRRLFRRGVVVVGHVVCVVGFA